MASSGSRALPGRRGMQIGAPRPAAAFAGAGAVATAAYFALPLTAQDALYTLVGAAAVAAVLVGAARYVGPKERLAWRLFAAGLALEVCGDAIFSWYDVVADREPPLPSLADVLYLSGYPVLFAGVVVLLRRRSGVGSLAALLDVAIVSAGFALVQWIFLIEPYRQDPSLTLAGRAVAMSYPAVDVLLLAGFAQLALRPAWRTWSFWTLVVSVLLMLVGDEVYGATASSYASGGWVDAFWLASYVLFGTAALDAAAAGRSGGEGRSTPRLTRLRLALLSAAVLTAPAVLVVERALGHDVHAYAVALGGGVLSALVLARLAGLLAGVERARAAERSARREAEEAQQLLSAQNERLREVDRLKDEFVSLVSHDLRTPLTSISGYVELLAEKPELDEESRSFVSVVSRNTGRLLRLVDDLLFVARLSAGGLELRLEDVELTSAAAHCVAAMRPGAEAGAVRLELVADGPVVVRAEPGRIAQLLDNLVSNAIKFTPGGGSISVAVAARAGRAAIEVADTGIGVPVADREHLFDRFYRSPAAVAQQIQGTGLGLHIARAVVEAHGGTIAVAERTGGGAVFRVELPLA